MTSNLFHPTRFQSAQKVLDSQQLDGILFTSLENIRYLCGFSGSDGALVLTHEASFFLTDSRYWTQADEEITGAQIVQYKKKVDGIASLLSDLRLKRIGFESASVTLSLHRALSEKLLDGPTLLPLDSEIRPLRSVKDDQELRSIRRAIDISSKAFQHMMSLIGEGVVENEMALEMEFFMKKSGAESLAFDIIVASGKRSALPHGKASDKRIEKGDLILVDFGSREHGYHSDETCTVVCGPPSPEQKKVFQIVKEAHDKAIELIRPGIPFSEVDATARNHIQNAGYGECFGHGLGHGVGLAVHEDPTVNGDNQGMVQEGMVFTVEPGIYIPNWGGVRLEDMVRVTSQGAEVLTCLPKELTVI